MLDPSEGIALFTDGSCWTGDHIGGWAWVAIDAFDGQEHGAGAAYETTNNRMEMTAWIEGLEYILDTYGAEVPILVYSDSEYVGFGATKRARKRKANLDLWVAIDEAVRRFNHLEFVWVKGHNGSEYNEIADELAGERRLGAQALIEARDVA